MRQIFTASRTFAVPRDRVFGAFADPALLARWWGPDGFTNTFDRFELRAGGIWRFTMHGPDGTDYPNESTFVSVDAPRQIVFRHLSGHLFTMTLTLHDLGDTTKLQWEQAFDEPIADADVIAFIDAANAQNLDRLAAVLA